MKNNSGVSLITLAITIIVFLSITGVSISYINDTLVDLKTAKYSSEVSEVEKAVKDWYLNFIQMENSFQTVMFDEPIETNVAIEVILTSPCNNYTREELVSRIADVGLYELKEPQFAELQVDGITPGAYYIFDINECVVYGPILAK